jgi:hypothetical protein
MVYRPGVRKSDHSSVHPERDRAASAAFSTTGSRIQHVQFAGGRKIQCILNGGASWKPLHSKTYGTLISR